MSKLRITSKSGVAYDAHIEVDDFDISSATRGVDLRIRLGEVITATLDLVVLYGVKVEGETRVVVPEETEKALVALGWTPPGALPPFDGKTLREHPGYGEPFDELLDRHTRPPS